jgi:hypothetical protein
MRMLRVALGAAVGFGATWAANELWKLLVHWQLSQGIHLSHGLNELISFLPVAIVNGYLLWRIHKRTLGTDVVWSIVGTGALFVAIALLADPSGGRLLLIWAVPVAFTIGPLVVVALLAWQRSRHIAENAPAPLP